MLGGGRGRREGGGLVRPGKIQTGLLRYRS